MQTFIAGIAVPTIYNPISSLQIRIFHFLLTKMVQIYINSFKRLKLVVESSKIHSFIFRNRQPRGPEKTIQNTLGFHILQNQYLNWYILQYQHLVPRDLLQTFHNKTSDRNQESWFWLWAYYLLGLCCWIIIVC